MKHKSFLTVAFIGHRNCGKSTLAGQLISLSETSKVLSKNANNNSEEDMKQLPPAFVVDRSEEEREKGQTIKFSLTQMKTNKYQYSICNVPGRRDLLKNMIRATSQADAAVLVVSALPDEFEVCLHPEGQTRWHSVIAHAFGINQFIVCITKTDEEEAKFSEDRYEEIKTKVSECLKKAGISLDKIEFIPVSGMTSDNLTTKSERFDWYKGPTLIEAMDNLIAPKDLSDGPLLVPVQRVVKVYGIGTVIMGKVQSGTMKPYMPARIFPSDIRTEIRIVTDFGEYLNEARTGTHVSFWDREKSVRDLAPGDVVGPGHNSPFRECTEFVAHVTILNHPTQIKEGYTPIISIHTASVDCRFKEIVDKFDKDNMNIPENEKKILKNGESGLVRMRPIKKLCLGTFQEFPQLGRFVIRDMSRVIGVGIVKSVTYATKGK